MSSLANLPHTSKNIQMQCMSHMPRAAGAIAEAMPDDERDYHYAACRFSLPCILNSEATTIYDPDKCLRFFSEEHCLTPRKLLEEYDLTVPLGFVERGNRVIDKQNSIDEEWWCIGQPI